MGNLNSRAKRNQGKLPGTAKPGEQRPGRPDEVDSVLTSSTGSTVTTSEQELTLTARGFFRNAIACISIAELNNKLFDGKLEVANDQSNIADLLPELLAPHTELLSPTQIRKIETHIHTIITKAMRDVKPVQAKAFDSAVMASTSAFDVSNYVLGLNPEDAIVSRALNAYQNLNQLTVRPKLAEIKDMGMFISLLLRAHDLPPQRKKQIGKHIDSLRLGVGPGSSTPVTPPFASKPSPVQFGSGGQGQIPASPASLALHKYPNGQAVIPTSAVTGAGSGGSAQSSQSPQPPKRRHSVI